MVVYKLFNRLFVGAFIIPVACDTRKLTTGICNKAVAGTILAISSLIGGVGLAVIKNFYIIYRFFGLEMELILESVQLNKPSM